MMPGFLLDGRFRLGDWLSSLRFGLIYRPDHIKRALGDSP